MMYGYVNWEADPKTGWDGLRKQAEFTGKYFPNKRLNVSFIPDEQVDCRKMAEVFNEAANICNFYGVSLNDHNHLAEFANRGKFIYTLLDTAPSLNFAYDLGWVCRAGFDPLKLLEDTGKRCTYVHLRDPKTERAEAFTLEAMKALPLFPDFGTGETDLQSQIDYLKNHFGPDDWAVVEHEGGEPDVQRYIRAKEVINRLCTIH